MGITPGNMVFWRYIFLPISVITNLNPICECRQAVIYDKKIRNNLKASFKCYHIIYEVRFVTFYQA